MDVYSICPVAFSLKKQTIVSLKGVHVILFYILMKKINLNSLLLKKQYKSGRRSRESARTVTKMSGPRTNLNAEI